MKIVGNSHYQKISNCLLMLNLLRNDTLSRLDISFQLGLQPSSVTYGISRLLEAGIVTEMATSPSNGSVGRKKNLISINENYGRVVGIDLTSDSYTMTILTVSGKVVKHSRFTLDSASDSYPYGKDAESFIFFIKSLIEKVKNATNPIPLLGVCVSVPGIIEDGRKGIKECWTLGMKDLDLSAFISSSDIPIIFENDANCAAMKYLWQSKDSNTSFFYLLTRLQSDRNIPEAVPVIGIGLAPVIMGNLVRGRDGLAGEYRSSRLMGNSSELYRQSEISSNDLLDLKKEATVERAFIRSLFSDVYCMMTIMDPDLVYVGGYLAMRKERTAIYSVLNDELADPFIRSRLREKIVVLDDSSKYDPSEGAACLLLDKMFTVPTVGDSDDDLIWSRQLLKKIM